MRHLEWILNTVKFSFHLWYVSTDSYMRKRWCVSLTCAHCSLILPLAIWKMAIRDDLLRCSLSVDGSNCTSMIWETQKRRQISFGTIIFFGVDNLNSFANCVCLAGENSFRFSSVSDLSLPILHASIAISSCRFVGVLTRPCLSLANCLLYIYLPGGQTSLVNLKYSSVEQTILFLRKWPGKMICFGNNIMLLLFFGRVVFWLEAEQFLIRWRVKMHQ